MIALITDLRFGPMDFFTILLPGALLTFLLMGEVGPGCAGDRYSTPLRR